jgi:phenylalanine-4-hydroxylase
MIASLLGRLFQGPAGPDEALIRELARDDQPADRNIQLIAHLSAEMIARGGGVVGRMGGTFDYRISGSSQFYITIPARRIMEFSKVPGVKRLILPAGDEPHNRKRLFRPSTDLPELTGVDPSIFIKQNWSTYTAEDHEVWGILYEKRMRELAGNGSRLFLQGAEAIGLRPDQVPSLAEVNARLERRTGWNAVPVKGFIPPREFFLCLANRRFPTTMGVRPKQQIDYLPEPDIFHDVFGHVPLHADPVFADFLQKFGAVAAQAQTPEQTEQMARLFWFTVEFGLTRDEGETKVYGSGLISSAGDAANALSDRCDRRPFTLDAVINQPFEIDRFQDTLFVVDSFEQLFQAVDEAGRRIAAQP